MSTSVPYPSEPYPSEPGPPTAAPTAESAGALDAAQAAADRSSLRAGLWLALAVTSLWAGRRPSSRAQMPLLPIGST